MTALHQATELARKFLAICAMLVIGGLLIYFGIKIGLGIKEKLYPTPPTPPTVTFGKLPAVIFPTQPQDLPKFVYTLNTVTGSYPDFGDRAHVYPITQPQPNLLALKNTGNTVASAGFTSTPTAISDVTYAWTNTDSLPKTITMNIQTNNFTLSSDYLTDPTVVAAQNVPDETLSISTVTDFLTSLNTLPSDIDTNKTKVSLLAITNGSLSPTSSLSTAQIVRVDLFQHDINGLPIFYTNPSYSSMYLLIGSNGDGTPQIVAGSFVHKSISSNSATYPIKTPEEAFKELQDGQGYIASFDPSQTQITIRNISMGYFMSDTDQPYLMPVIVFQGDNNFFAYVSAVSEDWIAH